VTTYGYPSSSVYGWPSIRQCLGRQRFRRLIAPFQTLNADIGHAGATASCVRKTAPMLLMSASRTEAFFDPANPGAIVGPKDPLGASSFAQLF